MLGYLVVLIPALTALYLLRYTADFFENYSNALSFGLLILTLTLLARALYNTGTAYGARCGKFEDMIIVLKLAMDFEPGAARELIEVYCHLVRDPSIMNALGKAGDMKISLDKVFKPLKR